MKQRPCANTASLQLRAGTTSIFVFLQMYAHFIHMNAYICTFANMEMIIA